MWRPPPPTLRKCDATTAVAVTIDLNDYGSAACSLTQQIFPKLASLYLRTCFVPARSTYNSNTSFVDGC
ncbi:hypothetical protein BLNAU_8501 [Blattamonas nauphoetae]|uniref:Uncharacterized protein n=1 Tax=Blattamonas nauphoetae TaxID=2049346 RepID=A0ABQ9XY76_9EUKA|nr:hypothetical protein BLNAU_8501 [Blattamonas nauphoetae]